MRKVLFLALWLLFFLQVLGTPVDLDLGWHLRYGEYFWQNGHVLKDNILSFFWPNYQWVEASWGFDLVVYQVFTRFGFLGLSVAGGLAATAIFLLITHPTKKKSPFELLLLMAIFLSQGISLYVSGLRSQTTSALFFALTLVIFHQPKRFLWLPLVFFLWANFHGGFSLGLILLFIMFFAHGLLQTMKKSDWLRLGFFLGLSTLTPLVNPWGLRIYEETFKHATNTNLSMITEWMPLTQGIIESTIALAVLFTVLCIALRKRSKSDIPFLVALLVVTYLSFSAIRFLILFAVMATYYVARNLPNIARSGRIILSTIITVLVLFDLLFTNHYFQKPYPNLLRYSWTDYCKLLTDCTEALTAKILENPPVGNGFHPYNWGGYLSWRVPMVKTFMDGRMAAWEDRGVRPPIGQLGRAMFDKTPIALRKLDNTYHFRWVILPTNSPQVAYLDELTKNDTWEARYRDRDYVYYVKK